MIRCSCGAELFSIESVCSVCIHPKPPRAIYVEDLRIKLANREEEILYWKEATEIANNENIELRAERDRLKAALQPFSDAYERLVRTQESMGFGDNATFGLGIKVSAIKAARKALGGDAS